VITVARTGPISAIKAKKRRKATAVQTTARPSTDPITFPDGSVAGKLNAAMGANTTPVTASEAAITPSTGRSESQRWRITGPTV